jgi:hypothetical protein
MIVVALPTLPKQSVGALPKRICPRIMQITANDRQKEFVRE